MILRLVALLALWPASASAALLCVNPGGTGGCFTTIQQAVAAAMSRDVVLVAAGTYVESVTVPAGRRVVLQGAGAGTTILDGDGSGTVLDVQGPRTQLTIDGLTVRNGARGIGVGAAARVSLANCAVADNAGGSGITLDERASVTITGCAISGNTSSLSGGGIRASTTRSRLTIASSILENNASTGNGGGLFSFGKVRITDSVVRGNTADDSGGGVWANDLRVRGSTFSGNHAAGNGGAIAGSVFKLAQVRIGDSTISGNSADFTGGGIAPLDGTVLDHVTVAGNTAGSKGGGIGLGHLETVVSLRATILADNTASTGADCDGRILRLFGGNLIESHTCAEVLLGGSTVLTADPMLGPLQNNGGPTETHAVGVGSQALAVLPIRALCRLPDQRGVPRTVPCDLGAFEAP